MADESRSTGNGPSPRAGRVKTAWQRQASASGGRPKSGGQGRGPPTVGRVARQLLSQASQQEKTDDAQNNDDDDTERYVKM